MSHSRWGLRALLAGLAAAGVVVAHTVAYLLAVPDPSLRAAFMAMSGHENWSLIISIAAGVLTFGLSGFVISSVSSKQRSTRVSFDSVALQLAGLQTIGFIVLEASERLLDGSSIGGLLGEPVVIFGLLTQLVVAIVGALLLTGFVWAVEKLLRPARKRHVNLRKPLLRAALNDSPRRIRIAANAAVPRAPPFLT